MRLYGLDWDISSVGIVADLGFLSEFQVETRLLLGCEERNAGIPLESSGKWTLISDEEGESRGLFLNCGRTSGEHLSGTCVWELLGLLRCQGPLRG